MFYSLTFLLVTEVFLLRSIIRILILVAATSIKIICFCHTQDLLIFLVGVVMAAAHRCGAQPRIGVLCFTIMPMQITPSSAPPQNRSHFAQAQKVAAFLFCSCPRAIREPMVWPQWAQQGQGPDAAHSQDPPRRSVSHSRRTRDSQPPTAVEINQFAEPGTRLSGSSGVAILARANQRIWHPSILAGRRNKIEVRSWSPGTRPQLSGFLFTEERISNAGVKDKTERQE